MIVAGSIADEPSKDCRKLEVRLSETVAFRIYNHAKAALYELSHVLTIGPGGLENWKRWHPACKSTAWLSLIPGWAGFAAPKPESWVEQ
jgi:hypothetical protein